MFVWYAEGRRGGRRERDGAEAALPHSGGMKGGSSRQLQGYDGQRTALAACSAAMIREVSGESKEVCTLRFMPLRIPWGRNVHRRFRTCGQVLATRAGRVNEKPSRASLQFTWSYTAAQRRDSCAYLVVSVDAHPFHLADGAERAVQT